MFILFHLIDVALLMNALPLAAGSHDNDVKYNKKFPGQDKEHSAVN
jgi:hypothetical protein